MAAKKSTFGVILFPEFLPIFKDMSPEEVKEVIVTALEYNSGMTINEPSGSASRIVWTLLKPRLDANLENYRTTCDNRAYGRYCQVMRDKGQEPLSREEWNERRQDI